MPGMTSFEPPSGRNLPPGCFGPPERPDPWEGRVCGECSLCATCRLLDGSDVAVCAYDPNRLEEIDPGRPAEECFE